MATLLPNAVQQFVDANGVPLAGGSGYFYIPNTTTPKDTWSDPGGTILNTNPIILDAAGENPAGGIYGSGSYRQVIFDANGNLIWDQLTADTSVGGLAWGGTSSGTANAQVIAASSFSAQDGQQISFLAGPGLTNTGALTVTPGTGNAIPVLLDSENGPTTLLGGEVAAGNAVTLIYDAARGAFHLVQNDFTKANFAIQINAALNLAVVASVAANALTVSIKTLAGNDPSPASPVYIPFRNVTAGSGVPNQLPITTATSLTISSGSTLGTANGVPARLWMVIFNDSTTARVGLVKTLSGTSIMSLTDGIQSATAEGGVGGADSAQVIYANATVTAKPMTVLAYLEVTEATVGTWVTAPSLLQLVGADTKLPGAIVQTVRLDTGALNAGTTIIPLDDSIPQITEGVGFMSQAMTPFSSANALRVVAGIFLATSAATWVTAAVFRDSGVNALSASMGLPTNGGGLTLGLNVVTPATSTAATTFSVRGGASSAGTITFNGSSGSRFYGGVLNSFLEINELMT